MYTVQYFKGNDFYASVNVFANIGENRLKFTMERVRTATEVVFPITWKLNGRYNAHGANLSPMAAFKFVRTGFALAILQYLKESRIDGTVVNLDWSSTGQRHKDGTAKKDSVYSSIAKSLDIKLEQTDSLKYLHLDLFTESTLKKVVDGLEMELVTRE